MTEQDSIAEAAPASRADIVPTGLQGSASTPLVSAFGGVLRSRHGLDLAQTYRSPSAAISAAIRSKADFPALSIEREGETSEV